MFSSPRVGFIVCFVCLYVAMHAIYFQLPDSALAELYRFAINEPAAWAINLVGHGPPVDVDGHRLVSPVAVLEIVRGCDGAGVVFITASAIIAFSAPWLHKAVGLVLGIVLIYGLNQLRVVVLYFVVVMRPDWFTPLHAFYIPTLIVIAASLYFLAWLSFSVPDDPPQPSAA